MLVQTIRTEASTVYPVVADPKWTWGIISGTVYLNRDESNKLVSGAGLASLLGIWSGPLSIPGHEGEDGALRERVRRRRPGRGLRLQQQRRAGPGARPQFVPGVQPFRPGGHHLHPRPYFLESAPIRSEFLAESARRITFSDR
ncbi:hypothetical protein [Kitasatospora sp. McL0602]|uniref:hypothetical protein n=1 Tax=Kitasatospora sp. McL0602 TaxID=3439530 RepID=UPI003F8CB5C9